MDGKVCQLKEDVLMTSQRIILQKAAQIFSKNKKRIIENWEEQLLTKQILASQEELKYFDKGIKVLISDFIKYFQRGDFKGYYKANEKLAKSIAYNDISFSKFIKIFHLFEDSYLDEFLESITDKSKYVDYLEAIDRVHHGTISIFSEVYFQIHDDTILAFSELATLRDKETAKHLERTKHFSLLLAKEMKLDDDYLSQLGRVAYLHDIGKIGIPDNILLKKGKLTESEFNKMKQHTTIGAKTIKKIIGKQKLNRGYLVLAHDIVLYHHEKYDGSGYPKGLKENQIPLGARIFALADAYDAIVSRRTYKIALPHKEAVKRIKQDAGKHFDPDIVKAFVKTQAQFKEIGQKLKDK